MLRRTFLIALFLIGPAAVARAQAIPGMPPGLSGLAEGEPPTLRLVYTGAVGGQLGPCG